MKNYPFIIKLIILIYINLISLNDENNIVILIGFSLVEVILTACEFSLCKKSADKILFLDFTLSLLSAIYLIPNNIFLYVFFITYFLKIKKNIPITLLSSIFMVIYIYINKVDWTSFFLVFSCSYIVLDIFNNYLLDTFRLEKENEDKGKNINELSKRIKFEEEYRKQVVYSLKLEERNKLSQTMHDKIGHTIAAALIQLEAVNFIMDKDVAKSKSMIDRTIEVLRNGMDDVRKTLRQIKPTDEQLGINKIKRILEEKVQNTSFKYSVKHTGDINKINNAQWMNIIEGIREASTNTIKYSKGDKIEVKVEVFNKIIKVYINDNGIGAATIVRGMGLDAMEKRILAINGKVIFDGSNGFSVVFLIPIEDGRINN